MAAPKRTKIQIEEQRTRVAAWYIQGLTQREIGRRLDLSVQQISYDLKVIRRRWNMDTAINLDAARMKELAKLEELEKVYWEGWRKSLEAAKSTVTEQTVGGDASGQPRTLARVLSVERDGNPAFLAGVESCIAARRKMLGLDAPQEIAGPKGGPIPIMAVHVSAQVLAEAQRILVEVQGHELPEPAGQGG